MERMLDVEKEKSGVLPDTMLPALYRIESVRKDTHDTFTIELVPGGDGERVPFLPGQFNMLYTFGVGEIPISISGDPARRDVLVHTTRAVGMVTRAMRKLKRNDVVGVRGPFGSHWPVEDMTGSDIVIVAGGIGLAPLRPALYALLAQREKYGKIVLLYGTRSPADILYKNELERWRSRFDLDVYITVDRAMEGWRGNVGVVTTLIRKSPFDPDNTMAMICGPEVMMRYTILELNKRGVQMPNIYVSMERNMKCAIGLCGHCQLGNVFICKDGPVFRYDTIEKLFSLRET
jgi:NAD(P)H-flavin reductase